MPAQSVDVRRQNFAAFVRRALTHAEETRGWSAPRVAQEAGIGSATIYRWRDGTGARSPLPDQVVAFCDALGIPTSVAFAILWPSRDDKPAAPAPLPQDPEVERQTRELLRRIADPNVSDAEKLTIRATLRHLTGEPAAAGRRRSAAS
jgi:transcriptional regulator with XRE-family HTH domain